jgi:uncharacterized protein YbjT (DUF2867 family)
MKITVLGSLGNISKPLAEQLIAAGHQVTVVSSSAEKGDAIKAIGATPAIGAVEDVDFLTKAFTGADAVYTMVPPIFTTNEWKKYIANTGKGYAEAITKAGVKNVVNLSSIGADLPDGVGPVSGIHFVEEALNALEGVNVLNLRPAYFYTNLYHSVDLIKNAGIIGGNYPASVNMVMVHPLDIADTAAKQLNELSFKGKSHLYIVSSEHTNADIASAIGKAIGKPELPWVEFKDEDLINAMTGTGASLDVATNYAEMGNAISSGIMFEDYHNSKSIAKGKIDFETFVKEFAKAF